MSSFKSSSKFSFKFSFRENLSLFLKSMLTGTSMLIPGLSGGTTALLLGIYHPLLHNASNLLSDRSRLAPRLRYLATAALGALLGLILFASPISRLYAAYRLPCTLVFVACAAFGLPAILKTGGVCKFTDLRFRDFLIIGAGFLVVLALSVLPTFLTNFPETSASGFSESRVLDISASPLLSTGLLLLSGIVLATALILPGISFSHMLLLLGLYAPTLNAIAQHRWDFLLALACSIILGALISIRACESLMSRYPRTSTLFIFGFVLASCFQIL